MIKAISGQEIINTVSNTLKTESAARSASFMESMERAVSRASGLATSSGGTIEDTNKTDARPQKDAYQTENTKTKDCDETAKNKTEQSEKKPEDAAKTDKKDKANPKDEENAKNEECVEEAAQTNPAIQCVQAELAQGIVQMSVEAPSQSEGTQQTLGEAVNAMESGNTALQAQAQAQAEQGTGMTLPDGANNAGTVEAGMAETVQNDQNQIDFVNEVMQDIDQTVASNEAERNEPVIEQANVEVNADAQQDAASSRVIDINKTQKTTKSENTELSQTNGTPINAAVTTGGAQRGEPDAVITVPSNELQAREIVQNTLLEQVESAVSQEKSELYIKFKPDVLGGMQIRLTMTQEGLHAQIRTSDAAMRSVIGAELSQLTESLRARGIEVVEMDVYYEQQTANNQFLDQRSGQWREQSGERQSGNQAALEAQRGEESGYEAAYSRMIPTDDEIGTGGVSYTA